VAFVLTGGACLQTSVQAELKISGSAALLELSSSEARLFSAQHIITVCSAALMNNKLDQTSRTKLLQFRGDAFFRTANTAAARSDFESILELLPEDSLARWNLARCLGKQGNVRRTFLECDRVLKTTPDFALAYATKSAAYFAQGDMTASFKMSSAAVEADVDCVYARYLRAIGYLQRREFARCVDDLNVAIRTNPFDPMVKPASLYVLRGEALYRLGDVRRAKRNFHIALKFDPQHTQALRGLWQIVWKERKFSLSVCLAEQLNQIAPDRVSTLRICCLAFGKARRYDEAAKYAENWTRRKPSDPDAHHLLGVIRFYQGREAEAAEHYRKALELKPTHAGTLTSMSLLLSTAGDATIRNPTKAKQYALELKRALPRQTPALVVVLAIVHAANDDFAQATRLMEQLLKRDDVDAERREQCESLLRRFRNRKPILAREHSRELF
jgi:tetratricopeptide (TPR) repeat protein